MKRAYRDSFVMAYCISEESIVCRTKGRYYLINVCRDVAREITGPQKIKALHKLQAKLPPIGKVHVRRYARRGHAVIAFDLGQPRVRWY